MCSSSTRFISSSVSLSTFATCFCSCLEAMQHFCNFAVSAAERTREGFDVLGSNGKLVRALGPHMSHAASSYALAASSAVSNVPNQILVFLHQKEMKIELDYYLKWIDTWSLERFSFMVKWITVMGVEFQRPKSPNASVSLLWIFVTWPWVRVMDFWILIFFFFWFEAGDVVCTWMKSRNMVLL